MITLNNGEDTSRYTPENDELDAQYAEMLLFEKVQD